MRIAGAVDIGGTSTKIGIVAEDGQIVTRAIVPTNLAVPALLVDGIVGSLRPMLDAVVGGDDVFGVGVSVAGFLDRDRGAMIHNANIPALQEFALRRTLEDRLSLECRLEVDSNAAVLAEYRHGAGRGSARLLGVTVGTGLGGGVIIDGELLRFTGDVSRRASTPAVISGEALPPQGALILNPLNSGALCEAVMTIPPSALFSRTAHETRGVGTASLKRATFTPFPTSTSADRSANFSERNR